MRPTLLTALVSIAATPILTAQSNSVAGLDGNLYDISSPHIWGRRGPAYPGGEIGFSAANYMCNPGSVPIPWHATMQPDHPKFGFMIVRVVGDRIEQVSDWSYIKHAFLSLNSNNGPCLPCQNPGGSGTVMNIGCSDVYAYQNNGDRYYLGPPQELDPWLGTWNPIGSYFDGGDPMVSPPQNADGTRSLTTTQTNAFDAVKNRVTIKESDLNVAGASYYYQIHLIHQGEPVANRANNLRYRGANFSWNGSSWSVANNGSSVGGSILNAWNGSSYSEGGNGQDDGRFAIAVKVTGPNNGFYHYEYAVQNIDNNRGGASFRLPVCPDARVQNVGFRDIDQDPLDDWTTSITSGEIAFLAPAGNSHRWNQLFNFWFDCDVAPEAGIASIDEATPGAGNLTVTVATQVPGLQAAVYLGAGCGSPDAELNPNGVPSAGNASFALDAVSGASTPLLVFFSGLSTPGSLGSGCTLYLDIGSMGTVGLYVTDASGHASIALPVAPGQTPADLYFQAASFVPSPPLFGLVGLSNALKVRFASTGCN